MWPLPMIHGTLLYRNLALDIRHGPPRLSTPDIRRGTPPDMRHERPLPWPPQTSDSLTLAPPLLVTPIMASPDTRPPYPGPLPPNDIW